MKNFVLIPDSFKGTLSSLEICEIMRSVILHFIPNAVVHAIPAADGGEGTVDAFVTALGGEKLETEVSGPFFQKMKAFYGRLPDGKTAIVEMAACAGLPLVQHQKNPEKTTTFGVGELFLDAAKKGCTKIIVGLGGSCTNDAGTGAATACGIRFLDVNGASFVPTGGTLEKIAKIDTSTLNTALKSVKIVTMCDINNPFAGPNGAACVFAPQKGAGNAMVQRLDRGLTHCGNIIQTFLGEKLRKTLGITDFASLPGAGAAGGMCAFFGSKLQSGIETVLKTVRFDEIVKNADLVFTGEGKIDSQSLRGKVVLGVAARTKRANVPLVAVVGDIGDEVEDVYNRGVSAIFSINHVAVEMAHARTRARKDLRIEMENILRLLMKFGV